MNRSQVSGGCIWPIIFGAAAFIIFMAVSVSVRPDVPANAQSVYDSTKRHVVVVYNDESYVFFEDECQDNVCVDSIGDNPIITIEE